MTACQFPTCPPHRARGAARAFSLVELLVVVAILSVLAALLVPTLGRAKYLGRVAVCLSNTRQQFQAIAEYAAAYSGRFPRHYDHSPEYLRSHNHDPSDNVIDNMKRWGHLDTQVTICPICVVYGHRYADTDIGGDYGGLDAGYPCCLGAYMWLANYNHWNGVVLQDGEPPFPTRYADCGGDTAIVTHRISLLDPYIRDIGHRGRGLYTRDGPFDFDTDTSTEDQPVCYGDGSAVSHPRHDIAWRFTIPGVGDYWY
jgi:prepilin-type N-terminal cleavage/methylation domain-containing protein